MTIKVNIVDAGSGLHADVVNHDEENALVVATRSLKLYESKSLPFSNPDYGIAMNVNALATGTPVKVHNGIDDILWTGTNIVDTVDFNSTTRPHTGTYSISFNAWSNAGDVCQLAKGSDQDLTGYVSLTLYLNIDKDWSAGDSVSIYGWDTTTGTIVGVKAFLEDYASVLVYDTWFKVTIPLIDLQLTGSTIDAIRFQYDVKDGKNVRFFVDDIQFEETGGGIEYTISPSQETWMHVHRLNFSFVDAYNMALLNSNVPNLSYNKILGVNELVGGIIWKWIQDGTTKSSFTIRNLAGALEIPTASISSIGSDGTNSFMNINYEFVEPIILKYETDDKMTVTINDDLTQLLRFRSFAGCKIENR